MLSSAKRLVVGHAATIRSNPECSYPTSRLVEKPRRLNATLPLSPLLCSKWITKSLDPLVIVYGQVRQNKSLPMTESQEIF